MDDGSIVNLLGVKDISGIDIYLVVSKLYLGVFVGYNWFWNIIFCYSDVN